MGQKHGVINDDSMPKVESTIGEKGDQESSEEVKERTKDEHETSDTKELKHEL